MVRKPKILVVGDSASVHSGLGKCIREIFTRIHSTGVFEIRQVGFFHEAVEPVGFKIYPTRAQFDSVSGKSGWAASDRHGETTIPAVLQEYTPDIVWCNHDPWIVPHLAQLKKRFGFKLLFHTHIESAPPPPEYSVAWQAADMIVPVTRYAERALHELPVNLNVANPIYDGVDSNLYRPYSLEEKKKLRDGIFGGIRGYDPEADPFVIGFVGRSHFRKRIDCLYHVASILANRLWRKCSCGRYNAPSRDAEWRKWKPSDRCWACRAKLPDEAVGPDFQFWFHIPAGDPSGWNLDNMGWQYDLTGKVMVTRDYKVAHGMSELQMPQVYNCMDMYLTFASEGFGLPIVEAMSCGIPVVSPAASASYEIVEPLNLHWTPDSWVYEAGLNVPRPQPNYHAVLDLIFKVVKQRRNADLAQECRDRASEFSWDKSAEDWIKVLSGFCVNHNGVIII